MHLHITVVIASFSVSHQGVHGTTQNTHIFTVIWSVSRRSFGRFLSFP